jgi:ABC-type Na+ efflux pump permease subunit
MKWLVSDPAMVRKLIVKDWQVYQKQLAGYVAGMLLALGLIGMGKPWSFSVGSLLLLVLLVVVGSYAIQSSLLTERKQQTVPFIMSLPVSPMDFYWGKLLANLAIYLVPFALVAGGMAALILSTPLPDGMLVWEMLVATFLFATFCVSLCVAIALESEGWNVFVMIAMMTLLGPFILWAGRLPGIAEHLRTENIVWNATASLLLAAELLVIAVAILATSWVHARKTSFL